MADLDPRVRDETVADPDKRRSAYAPAGRSGSGRFLLLGLALVALIIGGLLFRQFGAENPASQTAKVNDRRIDDKVRDAAPPEQKTPAGTEPTIEKTVPPKSSPN